MNDRDRQLAEAWFQKGENDLLGARNNLSADDVPTDVVCFHCQQAAEKYIKGFLAWHAIPFGRTHDLVQLLQACVQVAPTLGALHADADLLTDYAVDVRYPDLPNSNPTLEQAKEAHDAAVRVRREIRAALGIVDPASST